MSRVPSFIIIVPGWCDSGPGHWQSLWADSLAGARRARQDDWIAPARQAWVDSLTRQILEAEGPVVIATHSLGCIATAHLPPEATRHIQGALLVAQADPVRRGVLADFAPVPYQPLPYRSIVMVSNNDPYCPVRPSSSQGNNASSPAKPVPQRSTKEMPPTPSPPESSGA